MLQLIMLKLVAAYEAWQADSSQTGWASLRESFVAAQRKVPEISAKAVAVNRAVVVTSCLLCAGPASLDVFGIFDGHGGKQAAAFASKHLAPVLLGELQQGSNSSESPGSHPCAAAAGGSSGRGGAGGGGAASYGGAPGELDAAAEVLACEEVRAWSQTCTPCCACLAQAGAVFVVDVAVPPRGRAQVRMLEEATIVLAALSSCVSRKCFAAPWRWMMRWLIAGGLSAGARGRQGAVGRSGRRVQGTAGRAERRVLRRAGAVL